MNIHSDINVRDQITPSSNFKLVSVTICINRSENDVAGPQEGMALLPFFVDGLDPSMRINPLNKPLRDKSLLQEVGGVFGSCTHEAIEIRFFDSVRVN